MLGTESGSLPATAEYPEHELSSLLLSTSSGLSVLMYHTEGPDEGSGALSNHCWRHQGWWDT